MNHLDTEKIEQILCERLCAQVRLVPRENGLVMLDTPFTFPDGDHYALYLESIDTGGIRITDNGHTFMVLSYENDVDAFHAGTRDRLREMILTDLGVQEMEGCLSVESSTEDVAKNVFRLGQAITRLYDLTFLNRTRVASTFYEDLKRTLQTVVPLERIQENYVVPNIPQFENYPIDFRIEAPTQLFVMGITIGRDKARLATIILLYLLRNNVEFDSLLVFEDQATVPRADLARLSNVGGEQVASLDAHDDLARKVLRRASSR
jgi:hypothetical protein